MGVEQCRSEHVHCGSGHFGRSQFRAGLPRRRYQPVSGGSSRHHPAADYRLAAGKVCFKFHPALALGVCAGARTTTAALGAVQDAVESETPALGYTVTYAVGNTLLIIWGVVIVLLI